MSVRNGDPTRRQTVGTLAALGLFGSHQAASKAQKERERQPTGEPAEKGKWTTLPPTPQLPEAQRSGLADVNGTSVYYAQFGVAAGPPVLLLHGGMGNSNYWGYQIEHLAPGHFVTVMDTRGHGRSPATSRTFSYGLFAQDVVSLLDHLGIPKISIVGWSDGAVTGLQLAMKDPERVARLFAFGANSSLGGMIPNGARSKTFVAYGNRCKREYATLSRHPERWPQLVQGLRAMWRTEPNFSERDLAAVKAPTTISDGEHDEIIKRNDTERMHRTITGSQLAVLPAVSHFAMLQDPGQFNARLDEFMKD